MPDSGCTDGENGEEEGINQREKWLSLARRGSTRRSCFPYASFIRSNLSRFSSRAARSHVANDVMSVLSLRGFPAIGFDTRSTSGFRLTIRAHASNEFFSSSSYAEESQRLVVLPSTTKETAFARRLISMTTRTTRKRRERERGGEGGTTERRTQRAEEDSVSIAITGAQPRANSHHGQNEPQSVRGENAEQS